MELKDHQKAMVCSNYQTDSLHHADHHWPTAQEDMKFKNGTSKIIIVQENRNADTSVNEVDKSDETVSTFSNSSESDNVSDSHLQAWRQCSSSSSVEESDDDASEIQKYCINSVPNVTPLSDKQDSLDRPSAPLTVPRHSGLNTSQIKTRRDDSPFHIRLTSKDSSSASMVNDAQMARKTVSNEHVFRTRRDVSPFHDRLATQETFSSKGKRSSKYPSRPRGRVFHIFLKSDNSVAGTEVSTLSKLPHASPARVRAPSPFSSSGESAHDRLASQQTYSSNDRRRAQKPARAPSPRPFYTLVTAGSFSGSDDFSDITMRRVTPVRTRKSNAHEKSSRTKWPKPKPEEQFHPRLPPSSSRKVTRSCEQSTSKKDSVTKNPTDKKKFPSQPNVYHRIGSLEGKNMVRRGTLNAVRGDRHQCERSESDIYQRLIDRGNKAAMKNILLKAKEKEHEHNTFAESCKNALMRKFKGSTLFRV